MTFKNNAARIALAALLTSSPLAVMAQVESGSPQQSVQADPNEETGGDVTAIGSLEQTPKAVEAPSAYDAEPSDAEVEGSMIQKDPEEIEGTSILKN